MIMTLADVKTEILNRADANYFNQAEYLARAESLFRSSLIDAIKSGNYTEEEIFGLISVTMQQLGDMDFFNADWNYLTPIKIIRIEPYGTEHQAEPEEAGNPLMVHFEQQAYEDIVRKKNNPYIIGSNMEVYWGIQGVRLYCVWKDNMPCQSMNITFIGLLPPLNELDQVTNYIQYGLLTRVMEVASQKLYNEITRSE